MEDRQTDRQTDIRLKKIFFFFKFQKFLFSKKMDELSVCPCFFVRQTKTWRRQQHFLRRPTVKCLSFRSLSLKFLQKR